MDNGGAVLGVETSQLKTYRDITRPTHKDTNSSQ